MFSKKKNKLKEKVDKKNKNNKIQIKYTYQQNYRGPKTNQIRIPQSLDQTLEIRKRRKANL